MYFAPLPTAFNRPDRLCILQYANSFNFICTRLLVHLLAYYFIDLFVLRILLASFHCSFLNI